jgi:hypothetical protein
MKKSILFILLLGSAVSLYSRIPETVLASSEDLIYDITYAYRLSTITVATVSSVTFTGSLAQVTLQSGGSITRVNVSPANLSSQIRDVEAQLEELRNSRQAYTGAFYNFDQKANELYNMLSIVLKSMKEMQSSVVRNLL